ncbi:MAG: DMT family transporter, partial [Geminicoccaceae bacterium]
MIGLVGRQPEQQAVLLVLVSALMWGLWWVPIRLGESMGLGGVWANLGVNFGGLLALGALAWLRPGQSSLSPRAWLGSILIGTAVSLYGASLSLTDVARAVLLFYLAPAWSTAIEVMFLGRRWHWRRLPPLILSFAGMLVVTRGEISLEGGGIGDLAALLSGLAWSAGSALVFTTRDQSAANLAFAVMIAAVIFSLTLLPLDWQTLPDLRSAEWARGATWMLLAGAIYLAPIILITLWGAERLPPATISFLLTAEILSGIATSAIFLDERFGWPEA